MLIIKLSIFLYVGHGSHANICIFLCKLYISCHVLLFVIIHNSSNLNFNVRRGRWLVLVEGVLGIILLRRILDFVRLRLHIIFIQTLIYEINNLPTDKSKDFIIF